MTPADGQAPAPRFGMLRMIAVYKLLKVLLLLLAAYGELRLHDASLSAKLVTWVEARPLGLERDAVTWVLEWLSGVGHGGSTPPGDIVLAAINGGLGAIGGQPGEDSNSHSRRYTRN